MKPDHTGLMGSLSDLLRQGNTEDLLVAVARLFTGGIISKNERDELSARIRDRKGKANGA